MESKSNDFSALAASFPLLVYNHGDPPPPDNSQTVLSVADGSSRTIQVPELSNYRCLETPQGVVLMVDAVSKKTCLWNPQTGQKLALPDKTLPEHCRCLLSGPASSPDTLVLVYALGQPELEFCSLASAATAGGAPWISQSYDMGLYEEIPGFFPPKKRYINQMAAVEGKFYFIKAPNVLGVFTVAGDPEPHLELATIDATTPSLPVTDAAPQVATMSYLLESGQELFLVCLFYLGCTFECLEDVGAYRMDFDKHEWCRVTDIGDRAFLLGPASFAASCSATEHGLKKGCVYFAFDFLADSNEILIIDLKKSTCEVVPPPTKDGAGLLRKPFWMVPVL